MENNLTIQKLNDKIEGLKKYFKEFNFGELSKQDEVKKLNELQNKLYNEEYKIGIVANMSAGKSTFINALFGTDILKDTSLVSLGAKVILLLSTFIQLDKINSDDKTDVDELEKDIKY